MFCSQYSEKLKIYIILSLHINTLQDEKNGIGLVNPIETEIMTRNCFNLQGENTTINTMLLYMHYLKQPETILLLIHYI